MQPKSSVYMKKDRQTLADLRFMLLKTIIWSLQNNYIIIYILIGDTYEHFYKFEGPTDELWSN